MKCIVPSFVGDFVNVVAWIMDNETVSADEHSYNNDGNRSSLKYIKSLLLVLNSQFIKIHCSLYDSN